MDDPIADLLTRCAAQDRAAFRELYSATSAKLMGVLLRMLKDRQEAEEALQEVYTRIWLRAQRFDPARGRGMTWVIAVARHLAIDRLRARPIETEEAEYDQIADSAPRAESRLIALGEARQIVQCFDTLEPARAAALRGAYLDGLSYADLAGRHDVPLNTMRTWLRRGLAALRDCMEGVRA
ncbi:MAG: RNA polymerase subunit sigma [Rhodobacterales bacterium 65-51]|uniref:sigma-70 family RNA polymerase sigma factor n=1 Tax=uncultured Gemmobacter sp. TaxID=1095917 RepID=UPI00095B523A|nr:sigma-70 family RNA polymerase sigma factor [uncultured Gemmobacter sp.]OJY27061.1 MAG: RNA polymerase subunit sigma [Rhodobacterales bacterium 65-51]